MTHLIIDSPYRARGLWKNPHLNTIWASKVRRVDSPPWQRTRLGTPDGDFLDVDCLRENSDKAVILLHGLEGNSDRTYIRGMARTMVSGGWDVLALNFRSCSGEPNRLPRSYHSGATEDLHVVVDAFKDEYDQLDAVGFSLGGNLLLKYLGEQGTASAIRAAVAISVPCDLAGSAGELARPSCRLYMWNFMRSLREKIRQKAAMFPAQVSANGLDVMRTFHEFDDRYTAPLHGFRDAEHYWSSCSCRNFLSAVGVPSLLLSARDDRFLSDGCFPVEACRNSSHVTLEMPDTGGHVGFMNGFLNSEKTYAEFRALEFLT